MLPIPHYPLIDTLVPGEVHTVNLHDLSLENSQTLDHYTLAFQFWGAPDTNKNNFILVEHALTANSHLTSYLDPEENRTPGWWEAIVGPF